MGYFSAEALLEDLNAAERSNYHLTASRDSRNGILKGTVLALSLSTVIGGIGMYTHKKGDLLVALAIGIGSGVGTIVGLRKQLQVQRDEEAYTQNRAKVMYQSDGLLERVREGTFSEQEEWLLIRCTREWFVDPEEGNLALIEGRAQKKTRDILPRTGPYKHDPEATDGWLKDLKP